MEQREHANFIMDHLIDTWQELSKKLIENPTKLLNSQMAYWQDFLNLCQNNSSHTVHPDKRFQYDEWQKNLAFDFIKKSYFLISQHIEALINNVAEDENSHLAEKFRFFTRQFIDAAAPTNFANINPEVLSKTIETNGRNLIEGMRNFLDDLERTKQNFSIKSTDMEMYKIGENIACTPGKVIYQNDIIQLIQYNPTTESIYENPILIIPPWINKFYILDLQQENSMVKWLVDKGYTVFMISWVNASSEQREKNFSDYLFDGPLAAVNTIKEITKSKINIIGYCIGGTLLSCLLSFLGNNKDIQSATFLATLLDFSEPGELGVFIDDPQISALEHHMQIKGYLNGNIMASVFNALRANDLIWSAFINNYLKGEKPKPFDFLYWNADSTNIPANVHSFYLRNMYLHNALIQPDKLKLGDVSIDLNKISLPAYFLAAKDDHIVPWKTCYKGMQCIGSSPKFVLTSSGHVAGIINPPNKNKYGYWTNSKKPKDPAEFLAKASYQEGSWWNDWIKWIKRHSGKLISTKKLKSSEKPIENAPGSFVKVRVNEIL